MKTIKMGIIVLLTQKVKSPVKKKFIKTKQKATPSL